MFSLEELEELKNIVSWSICEGYITEEINYCLKNIIDKLNFSKEELEEIRNISGKKIP